jgi:IS5 family transposase
MGQMGFFDLSSRYAGLDKSVDPLVLLNDMVPFEDYRDELRAIWRTPPEQRKSNAGRPPWDEVLIFKTMILQQLYNLSDDQIKYQIRDRLSFMRFLGLGIEDSVPDAKTIWRLAGAGKMKELFDKFDAFLREKGYLAMGGQIVDASIVPVPRQHNKRDENEKIKAGETPEEWEGKPNKKRQKDVNARWTKKHGKSYYGYKNHINVDRRHKFIRAYDVTDASVHDSQALAGLIDASNTSSDLWADSAYRSQKIENELEERGLHSHIHHKGRRGKPLGERQQKANRRRSKGWIPAPSATWFQAKRIWTSLPRSLRMAWKGVRYPRHFLGVRLYVMTIS